MTSDILFNIPPSWLDISFYLKNGIKNYKTGEHQAGMKTHSPDLYKVKLPHKRDVFLHWSFCTECQKIRTKYLIAYDNEKFIAYVRELIESES